MAEQKAPVKKSRKLMKRITTALAIVLGLVIAFMLFVYIMPGWGLYFVKSGSMEPSISPGDIVITKPVSALKVGEVITFTQNEAIVTHRIIAIKDGVITTKGDANEDADPHPLTVDRVEGIYLFKIPYLGYINSLVSNRKGWFIIIIIPTVILVVFIVKDIVKESLKKETQTNKETKGGDANGNKR